MEAFSVLWIRFEPKVIIFLVNDFSRDLALEAMILCNAVRYEIMIAIFWV